MESAPNCTDWPYQKICFKPENENPERASNVGVDMPLKDINWNKPRQ